ncbi:DoxX family protein [Gordonia oryzae]|uniref:DoxX family protein n=1 Tax=Gordonia oryzae TaxID=2487349 RepID=A0A3N4GVZ1_9ACTN|nr:DoxX family protein [Gordonia oryzae]RPA65597.1 DoxX family protein [Gordonia oryzae]
MANTPGGNDPGGRNTGDPDGATESRPISVSELLARTQAADAANATTGSRRDRGRRRAGRAGAVSVSELTGEIPRVEGPAGSDTQVTTPDLPSTPAPSTPAPSTPAPSTPASSNFAPSNPVASAPARSTSTPDGPQTAPWSPSPSSGAFPRSQNPLAARGPATGPVTEPGPRVGRGASSGAASGMPSFAPPPTRDFTSDDVSRRLRDQPVDRTPAAAGSEPGGPDPTSHDPAAANAVTGIIPLVDDADADADAGADTEDTAPRNGRFEEVFDEDFEAYRSFADVEHAEEKPKKKRRWFGRGKNRDTAAVSAAAENAATAGAAATGKAAANTDEPADTATRADITHQPEDVAADAVTGIIPIVDDSEVGADVHILDADDVEGADLATPSGSFGVEHGPFDQTDHEHTPTVAANVLDPADEPESHRDEWHRDEAGRDDSAAGALAADVGLGGLVAASRRARDTDFTDEPAETVAANVLADHADADPADADPADADHADADPTDADPTDADHAADHPTDADHAESGPVADETAAPESRDRGRKARRARKAEAANSDDGRESWVDRKPVLAWLAVIAEVVAGLVIGVGLFWGFTELWKWNPYFALVLAVLVIFGIVTFTHLVRRTSDLITTLLALAVGLIVTIGPLVLLST